MKQSVRTHGRTFIGIVVADRMPKTATVEWERWRSVPKYERFRKLTSRVKAHNEIDAKKGDVVKLVECRPLSKTKHFMIVEKLGHEELFVAKEELKSEGKVRKVEDNESSKSQDS